MAKNLYRKSDEGRVVSQTRLTRQLDKENYRTPWRRDFARLVHSAAFRRLQGKTQLFPNHESDFFRNRLTHSLEVAQVAKSIAIRINATEPRFRKQEIKTDIVETAALCHDLGHPPFGHNGEEALDECMKDLGGFEGNAQTLRILAKLEKRQTKKTDRDRPVPVDDSKVDCRAGLNLTYRTLASILKYDHEIPQKTESRKSGGIQKGYYRTEKGLVADIKRHVLGSDKIPDVFKTIECAIMDVADDIAYSTYDLEDAFKAQFLSPMKMISASEELLDSIADQVTTGLKKHPQVPNPSEATFTRQEVLATLLALFSDILSIPDFDDEQSPQKKSGLAVRVERASIASAIYDASNSLCENGYLRTEFTSNLVGRFIRGIQTEYDATFPPLSKVYLSLATFKEVEVLKHFSFQSLIMSPMLKVVAHRGKDIVKNIFSAIKEGEGSRLMPADFRNIYDHIDDTEKDRLICDYIAGMTDKYALEFYGRLNSTEPETIFKPL